jgi:hypothetical protein
LGWRRRGGDDIRDPSPAETAWPKDGRSGYDVVTTGTVASQKVAVPGNINEPAALELVTETVAVESAGFRPSGKVTRLPVGAKPFAFVFDRADGKGRDAVKATRSAARLTPHEEPAAVHGNDIPYALPQCWRSKLGL